MEYTKGLILEGKIIHVAEEYLLVKFPSKETGILHKSKISPQPEGNLSDNYYKNQSILVSIDNIDNKGYKLGRKNIEARYEDQKRHEIKEREKQKMAEERERMQKLVEQNASLFKRGVVYEAEVTKLFKYGVRISISGIEGYIRKEELNWNENDSVKDSLFEGEIINAVFLEYTDGKLWFGTKYLEEKPYNDDLYSLSTIELLNKLGHSSNTFIAEAKYIKGLCLTNLYSEDGTLLVDPIKGNNIIIRLIQTNIEEGKFYEVQIKLINEKSRRNNNDLFVFQAISAIETYNPYKKDVELAFKKLTSPSACTALAKTLEEIGKNMFSSKDRIFFELIQNADDAASKNGVSVNVRTIDNYFIICHNGYSFNKEDFNAITSSANGTKKANENQTGYKGIGFKSIFADSEMIYIKTGGYQFKFDKNYPLFSNFEDFYFITNEIFNDEEQKQTFLLKFKDEKNKFGGVSDIPWQIEPIWVDNYPDELGTQFITSNVAIALKLGKNKIEEADGYKKVITEIICNPKFMLFLRNTKRIKFNEYTVNRTIKNDIITLKNSFGTNRIERFKHSDFKTSVNNVIFKDLNLDIRILIEKQDELTGEITEAKFVDTNNHELDIPKKIAINNSTTISFAILLNEDGTIKPNTECNEISLFAFLPTLVTDFMFPFYINANFMLNSSREKVLGDNSWNFYLMSEIAKKMIQWCAELNAKQDRNALNILIFKYFKETTNDIKHLSHHFNTAYKNALESEAFILNHKGELAKQDAIIIDYTDLSTIIGADLFCKIIGTSKCLPSDKIDSKILEKDIFELIETIDFYKVIDPITNNSDFNEWFIFASEDKKQELYEWIKKQQSPGLMSFIDEFLSNLPIFQFGDEHKSIEEIKNTNYVITREHIAPIKEILEKLDFKCSTEFFGEHPIYNYLYYNVFTLIVLPTDEELFKSIKDCDFSVLSIDERKTLFFALQNFAGVGDAKLKEIKLFKNVNGAFKPLGEMIAYRADVPVWLNDYVLCEEDSCSDLYYYLIKSENEFTEIIQNNFQDINVSTWELYQTYKNVWTGQFTRSMIDNYKIDNDLLTIIEESDTTTKNYFLNKTTKIEVLSTKKYDKNSLEYRTLRIALDVLSDLSEFSSKIFFDGQCINKFSVSDDVFCEYMQNGEKKKVKMSLAKLLPTYRNESEYINKFKDRFDVKTDLDKFFNTSRKQNKEIIQELELDLKLRENNYCATDNWSVNNNNAYQYLFHVHFYRYIYGYTSNWVKNILLEEASSQFINEMMNFLYENKIDILTSPFTYRVIKYFKDKYIQTALALDSEKVIPAIEQWADDDKKRKYLIQNGVKTADNYVIKFRQLFLENKPIDFINKLSEEDLKSSFEFFTHTDKYKKDFNGENQINILISIKDKYQSLLTEDFDFEIIEDKSKSKEWDTKEYKNWIKNHYPHIFIYDGNFPHTLSYKEEKLVCYTKESVKYVYNYRQKKLYITNSQKIDDTIFELAKDRKAAITFEDYKILCMDGKVSISQEELKQKNDEIEQLKEQIKELEEYKKKYGELNRTDKNKEDEPEVIDILETSDSSNNNPKTGTPITLSPNLECEQNVPTIKQIRDYAQQEIDLQRGTVIIRDGIPIDAQVEAHKEAVLAVIQKLKEQRYDCSNLNEDDCTEWQSYSQIKNVISPEGETINLVVKSAKDGYIYLSATDFEYLTSNRNNILMVWDGNNAHSVTANDIFQKDSDVNLIFDIDYTPKHYFAALSKVFKYIKKTTFAVKDPKYNVYDAIKSFGMDAKTEGIQDIFNDNDL